MLSHSYYRLQKYEIYTEIQNVLLKKCPNVPLFRFTSFHSVKLGYTQHLSTQHLTTDC